MMEAHVEQKLTGWAHEAKRVDDADFDLFSWSLHKEGGRSDILLPDHSHFYLSILFL